MSSLRPGRSEGGDSSDLPPLVLRPASEVDARRLREWRNDPEARAASRNTGEVGAEEHAAWLAGVLNDPDRRLLICELDGEAIGQVRFDRRGERYEISIALAAEARGRELGARVVSLAVERLRKSLPGAEVEAHVRATNDRSLAAFRRAGFRPKGEAGDDGFLVLLAPAAGSGGG